jgi:hypothetical protein
VTAVVAVPEVNGRFLREASREPNAFVTHGRVKLNVTRSLPNRVRATGS